MEGFVEGLKLLSGVGTIDFNFQLPWGYFYYRMSINITQLCSDFHLHLFSVRTCQNLSTLMVEKWYLFWLTLNSSLLFLFPGASLVCCYIFVFSNPCFWLLWVSNFRILLIVLGFLSAKAQSLLHIEPLQRFLFCSIKCRLPALHVSLINGFGLLAWPCTLLTQEGSLLFPFFLAQSAFSLNFMVF